MRLVWSTYTDANEELIEVDGTGLVSVEELHEALALSLGDVASNVLESSEEFIGIALSVTILGVEVSEGSAKTSDSSGTSGLELGAHLVENYTGRIELDLIVIKQRLASLMLDACVTVLTPVTKLKMVRQHCSRVGYLLATAFMCIRLELNYIL